MKTKSNYENDFLYSFLSNIASDLERSKIRGAKRHSVTNLALVLPGEYHSPQRPGSNNPHPSTVAQRRTQPRWQTSCSGRPWQLTWPLCRHTSGRTACSRTNTVQQLISASLCSLHRTRAKRRASNEHSWCSAQTTCKRPLVELSTWSVIGGRRRPSVSPSRWLWSSMRSCRTGCRSPAAGLVWKEARSPDTEGVLKPCERPAPAPAPALRSSGILSSSITSSRNGMPSKHLQINVRAGSGRPNGLKKRTNWGRWARTVGLNRRTEENKSGNDSRDTPSLSKSMSTSLVESGENDCKLTARLPGAAGRNHVTRTPTRAGFTLNVMCFWQFCLHRSGSSFRRPTLLCKHKQKDQTGLHWSWRDVAASLGNMPCHIVDNHRRNKQVKLTLQKDAILSSNWTLFSVRININYIERVSNFSKNLLSHATMLSHAGTPIRLSVNMADWGAGSHTVCTSWKDKRLGWSRITKSNLLVTQFCWKCTSIREFSKICCWGWQKKRDIKHRIFWKFWRSLTISVWMSSWRKSSWCEWLIKLQILFLMFFFSRKIFNCSGTTLSLSKNVEQLICEKSTWCDLHFVFHCDHQPWQWPSALAVTISPGSDHQPWQWPSALAVTISPGSDHQLWQCSTLTE